MVVTSFSNVQSLFPALDPIMHGLSRCLLTFSRTFTGFQRVRVGDAASASWNGDGDRQHVDHLRRHGSDCVKSSSVEASADLDGNTK